MIRNMAREIFLVQAEYVDKVHGTAIVSPAVGVSTMRTQDGSARRLSMRIRMKGKSLRIMTVGMTPNTVIISHTLTK